MKKITFNDHIKYIGVEFEGFYTQTGIDNIKLARKAYPYFSEIVSDGSLHSGTNDADERYRINDSYGGREVRTNPLNEEDLNGCFAFMDRLFKKQSYKLNDSCGLHYHISFRDYTFANLCKPEFFEAYVEMVRLHFPEVWNRRYTNNYSVGKLEQRYGKDIKEIKKHFQRQSRIRYGAINYCYQKHGTVEFRFFGSSRATIESLADCIDKTIVLIEQFNKKKPTRINRRLSHEEKKENNIVELQVQTKLNTIMNIEYDIQSLPVPVFMKPSAKMRDVWMKSGIPTHIDYTNFQNTYGRELDQRKMLEDLALYEGPRLKKPLPAQSVFNRDELERIIRGLTSTRASTF